MSPKAVEALKVEGGVVVVMKSPPKVEKKECPPREGGRQGDGVERSRSPEFLRVRSSEFSRARRCREALKLGIYAHEE